MSALTLVLDLSPSKATRASGGRRAHSATEPTGAPRLGTATWRICLSGCRASGAASHCAHQPLRVRAVSLTAPEGAREPASVECCSSSTSAVLGPPARTGRLPARGPGGLRDRVGTEKARPAPQPENSACPASEIADFAFARPVIFEVRPCLLSP